MYFSNGLATQGNGSPKKEPFAQEIEAQMCLAKLPKLQFIFGLKRETRTNQGFEGQRAERTRADAQMNETFRERRHQVQMALVSGIWCAKPLRIKEWPLNGPPQTSNDWIAINRFAASGPNMRGGHLKTSSLGVPSEKFYPTFKRSFCF